MYCQLDQLMSWPNSVPFTSRGFARHVCGSSISDMVMFTSLVDMFRFAMSETDLNRKRVNKDC